MKPNINFTVIEGYNPKFLSINDVSYWGILEDKPAIIEIYKPQKEEPIIHVLEKNTVMNFNSSNLFINCGDCDELVDLPDGLYKIIIKGSPDSNKFQRWYFKADGFYTRMFSLKNKNCCGKIDTELIELHSLIIMAKGLADIGEDCKSAEIIEELKRELKRLEGCQC